MTRFQKIAIGVAGITALGIGGFILSAPHLFYASYGIVLEHTDQLSELRATASGLTMLGFLMLGGLVREGLRPVSVATALTVFLGYPAGRLVSIALDGVPSAGILTAMGLELLVAALVLAAFRPRAARAGEVVCLTS